jgi:hypothetical protein
MAPMLTWLLPVGASAAICRRSGAKWLVICTAILGCGHAVGASPDAAERALQPIVTVVNLGGESVHQVPVTFGEPFPAGNIPKGNTIVAYANGTALQTQADIKARNPDGSVRHAILTVQLPSLGGDASVPLSLRAVPAVGTSAGSNLSLNAVLQSGFDASVEINISGQPWHLDARTLLGRAAAASSCKPYGRACNEWLSGPLASEWIVGGPVLDARGKPNPHIAVYFAVRAYGPAPVSRVRVDVMVENDWAYAPDPQNVTYDAKISINGETPFTIDHLEHYVQARWHKVFWWGRPDPVYARQDSHYLQATRSVPRYEDVQISQKVLQKAVRRMQHRCGPMKRCDQTKNQANAGAQAGIGPLPRWTSAYVIDTSYKAYNWMLANSDALASYGIHYRDQITGGPVSVDAHPCVTLERRVEVSHCPVEPYADDSFPRCKARCKSPLSANISHHPSPAYVAYLVTGDWYYLEELKFWADWVEFKQNPKYRDYRTGLLDHNTLRGQAWALRTLGYAAYVLPDDDPLKGYFNRVVKSNMDWYNQNYTDNSSANNLHIITNKSIVYPSHGNPRTGISTWQASFFTWSVGNLHDLGFAGADKLLDWVGAFQVNLMTSPDFCWIVASAYELQVRDTENSPLYDSLRTVYSKTYPQLQGVACGSAEMAALLSNLRRGHYRYAPNVMVGYPESPTGYPANFQIGLAVAADSGVPNAAAAWRVFENRSVKPSYSAAPQFAVIPRTAEGDR